MEAFACGVAAVSLGRNCLSTLKALHSVYEKYRDARSAIVAFHSEITVIAASMQYINVIFEQHTDLAKKRFYENPELEQTFEAALAGCNLVLSCLDERVEKILADLGPETSKGRKGKAELLWHEEAMKELLSTLRGQHSAIFSIIQCFQVQNIADLGTKIDQLRVIVKGNHHGVKKAVKELPSASHLQLKSPYHANSVPRGVPRMVSPLSFTDSTASSTSSRERVETSYRHYQATISSFPIGNPSRSISGRQLMAYGYEESNDDEASVRGLAPSTIIASDPSKNDDVASDQRSVISAISTSSWTLKWLETQLSPEATIKALRRVESTLSTTPTSISDAENSIVASDVQTFLENIRCFMPILADTDANDRETGSQSGARVKALVDLEDDMLMQHHMPAPDNIGTVEVSRELTRTIDDLADWLPPDSAHNQQFGSGNRGSTISNQGDDVKSDTILTSTSHEQNSYWNAASETDNTSTRSFKQVDILQTDEEGELSQFAKPKTDSTQTTAPPSVMSLSIHSEKHLHPRGMAICAPTANYARRNGHGFSQALAESAHGPTTGANPSLPIFSAGRIHSTGNPHPRLISSPEFGG